MKITNILFVSPMYKEIRVLVEETSVQKNFRFIAEDDLTEEDLDWADAFVSFNTKRDYDYSKVKWVHSLGAGVDRFLYEKEWPKDVVLTRTICSFGQRISEYCLSYILKDLQFHDKFTQLQQQQTWQPLTPALVQDQKLLVYGTGVIGQEIAKTFCAFGTEVYGVSLSGAEKEYFQRVFAIDQALSKPNDITYVINTLPLTENTTNLFNNEMFQQFNNVGFINVGRGATVDEQALLAAIERNCVKFAVLDVFAKEPLPLDHPLWYHPKVSITPHISAVTTPEEGVQCFVDTLKRIEEQLPLSNQVNIEKGF